MARSSRTPRPLPELLKALDDHHYLLRHALHGLREDHSHIKTIAAELRTLVCKSSGTEGLLWRLIDELKVSDEIELRAAQSVNRDNPLNRGLAIFLLPFSRAIDVSPGPSAELHSLRHIIKQCEAIYVAELADRIFTHELLIGAIAGQMGTAHEAEGLDYSLVQLKTLLLNNREIYFKVLAIDAELALQIGERVLDHAERNHGYRRVTRPRGYGDVTLCVRLVRNHVLAGQVPILSLRSDVGEAEINCTASPLSVVFTLKKRGAIAIELRAAYPNDWEDGTGPGKRGHSTFCMNATLVRLITGSLYAANTWHLLSPAAGVDLLSRHSARRRHRAAVRHPGGEFRGSVISLSAV